MCFVFLGGGGGGGGAELRAASKEQTHISTLTFYIVVDFMKNPGALTKTGFRHSRVQEIDCHFRIKCSCRSVTFRCMIVLGFCTKNVLSSYVICSSVTAENK